MRNIFQQGPYRQSESVDLWLPVKGALVAAAVKCVPVIAVTALACLVGRGFGILALALAAAAEYSNYNLPPQHRIKTAWTWAAGFVFVALWLLDSWPLPAHVVTFALRRSVAAPTVGQWLVMWRFDTHTAWQPMGAWLALRIALIVTLPLAVTEPWQALNWRTLIEIVAPTFANSITAPPLRTPPAPEDAQAPRHTSAVQPAESDTPLF